MIMAKATVATALEEGGGVDQGWVIQIRPVNPTTPLNAHLPIA